MKVKSFKHLKLKSYFETIVLKYFFKRRSIIIHAPIIKSIDHIVKTKWLIKASPRSLHRLTDCEKKSDMEHTPLWFGYKCGNIQLQ